MSQTQQVLDYIQKNASVEIKKVRELLAKNRVIILPLAQKMGGKTYYLQFFTTVLGEDLFEHISAGEIVRELKTALASDSDSRAQTLVYFTKLGLESKAVSEQLTSSSSANLVPDEVIFAIIKDKISKIEHKKSIILDGFPRSKAQVHMVKQLEQELGARVFSFYFDTAYEILDVRANSRRVCPKCKFDKNIISSPTEKVISKNGEFILICDKCKDRGEEVEMIVKPGDEAKDAILKARIAYEELMTMLKDEMRDEFVDIQMSVKVDEYKGPLEEVNRAYSYSVAKTQPDQTKAPSTTKNDTDNDTENNREDKVLITEQPQVIDTQNGKVYAKSPEFATVVMLKKLSSNIQPQ